MQLRWLVVISASLVAPARADDQTPAYTPPDFMSRPPPLPPGADASTAWRMDLAEALRIAMHQNFGIVVERESVQIAHLGITVAGGSFEPQLLGSYLHSSADQPPLVLQAGTAGEILTYGDDNWVLTASQKLSTGAKLGVTFYSDRASSSAGTAVEPLIYNSSLTLNFTQPVLRGFSADRVIPRIDILRAQLGSERERAQLAISAMTVVEQTEDAYWDVVGALYSYDVDRQSMQRAVDQLELTKRQIAAGTAPPSDLIGAESTRAQRDLTLVQAELTVEQAWDRLRAALNLPRDQWSRPILPTEAPRFSAEHTTPEQALQVAIASRPELAQVAIDLKNEELSVRQAENNKLPEIDVSLSAGLLGQDNVYSGALREFGRADAKTYGVGVNLIWTPLNRANTAAAEIERARQRVAVVNRDKAVQDTWSAVRDAVRNLSNAERQVYAAGKSRELSEQTLDVEQRRFVAGNSSNIFVAQRQVEVATAQLAELDAILAHAKARAALLHATGKLLDERGIQLDLRK
ncbi:MAG TPA: TolC family protein [Kofleriaceae bacterium]|nr:TolC family protein [Kofleriaceae bacterium]